mmetsp:Transcript_41812/g.72685  ORF Transcript_41812/g.72685 Transcript_41812/m.72685 type:complete len:271 (+) Transcript_41812:18-830(+)
MAVAFILGCVVGMASAFIILVLLHRTPAKKAKKNLPHVYMNIKVLNAKEVVESKVAEKMAEKVELQKEKIKAKRPKLGFLSRKSPPQQVAKLLDKGSDALSKHADTALSKLGKGAGSLASVAITDRTFSKKMGAMMVEQIPPNMKSMGITATAELAFVSGPFFVVVINLHEVDISILLEKQTDLHKARMYDKVMGVLGRTFEDNIQKLLIRAIELGMKEKMGPVLQQKMKEKAGLDIEMEVTGRENQGDYFFGMLSQINEGEQRKLFSLV